MFGKTDTNEKKGDTTRIDAVRIDSPASSPAAAQQFGGSSIGSALRVQGEVTGSDDLYVEGRVDGTITLKQNKVTIGKNGRVQANIFAKSMIVEGEVTGDLEAAEQILVRKSGLVKGNLKAPRIVLEDGARIKGAIDTDISENLLLTCDHPPQNGSKSQKAEENKAAPARPIQ